MIYLLVPSIRLIRGGHFMPLIISDPAPTSRTVKETKQNVVYIKKVTFSKIAPARHFSMKNNCYFWMSLLNRYKNSTELKLNKSLKNYLIT